MRSVSQFYDEALRPVGIKGTQFSLLVAVKLSAPVLVTQLAEYTVMDRTTLTRNLDILEKQGLISISAGHDRRTRLVQMTQPGIGVLETAYPLWEQAQAQIQAAMTQNRLQHLMADLATLIAISHTK